MSLGRAEALHEVSSSAIRFAARFLVVSLPAIKVRVQSTSFLNKATEMVSDRLGEVEVVVEEPLHQGVIDNLLLDFRDGRSVDRSVRCNRQALLDGFCCGRSWCCDVLKQLETR